MLQGAISIESDGDGGSGGALAAKLKILRAAHWPTEMAWPARGRLLVSKLGGARPKVSRCT